MREAISRAEDFVEEHKAYFLLAVFALALGIRLYYNFVFLSGASRIGSQWLRSADSYSYYSAAHQVLNLQYFNFDRAPFFPFVIAVVQFLLGRDPQHVRIVLCLMGSFSCVLIFLVGEMAFNTRVAVFASLVSVFYLPLMIVNAMILSETLYVLLSLLVLYLIFKLLANGKTRYFVLCGLCMALTALTRAEFLFFIPFLLLGIWAAKRREHFGKWIAVMLVIVLVLTVPWCAFASSREHSLVLISSVGGVTFACANNPKMVSSEIPFENKGYTVWYTSSWLFNDADYEAMKGMTWGQISDYVMKRSMEWLRKNPGKIPTLLLWKQFSFWFSPVQFTHTFIKAPRPRLMMISYCIQYFFILLMFLFGALKTFSLRKHFPFLVLLAGEVVVGLIWAANWRNTTFLQPIFLLFAGALLFGERTWVFRKPRKVATEG